MKSGEFLFACECHLSYIASRAGFTARVLVITETDGLDAPGHTSREADKVTQLEARTRAYGDQQPVAANDTERR